MAQNAANLTAPLLMVSGTEDQTQRNSTHIFAQAPKDALNRLVPVHTDHRGTPAAGRDVVIEWLKELERR
jgi:hypothetical protein